MIVLEIMEEKIAIIGAGEIGQALSFLLKKKNLAVNLWDKDPQKNLDQQSLEEVVKNATVLFICVPSWVAREAIQEILPLISSQTTVVSLTKGISLEQKTIDQILQELLPASQFWALLSGPMLAEEIKKDLKGAAVVASPHQKVWEKLKSLFSPDLILTYSAETTAVALTGVLKNVYAVGLGIISALSWGGNLQGFYLSQAISEMIRIAQKLNISQEIILGPAGLGDLIATGFSQYSLNHQMGQELVQTGQCSRKCEGISSFEPLVQKLGGEITDLPILSSLSGVISHQQPAKDAFESLIR